MKEKRIRQESKNAEYFFYLWFHAREKANRSTATIFIGRSDMSMSVPSVCVRSIGALFSLNVFVAFFHRHRYRIFFFVSFPSLAHSDDTKPLHSGSRSRTLYQFVYVGIHFE